MLIPPELALTIACCRWPPTEQGDEAIRQGFAAVEPTTFLAVVARHRVEGLAWAAVRRTGTALPREVAASLAERAERSTIRNLMFAAEGQRVMAAFRSTGLPLLFIKGVTLNRLAYGSLALKGAIDIDILVHPSDYSSACDVLEQIGYRCIVPGGTSRERILEWAACTKDSAWRHEQREITVELHQRLTPGVQLLPTITVHSRSQEVAVTSDITLPTLARDELLVYLCVHGIRSGWARLKWAADLNALLGDDDGQRMYLWAHELGVARSAAVALLLLNQLFGRALPDAIRAPIEGDPRVRFLQRHALRSMRRCGQTGELQDHPLGTASIHLSHLLISPGLRHKHAELRQKVDKINLAELRLSAAFKPLAPIIALPAWLLRRLLSARRGRGPSPPR